MVTPKKPLSTFPLDLSCSTTVFTMLLGIANPIPMYPPERLKIAVFMPITSPLRLISGPPELPGLIAASV